MLAVHIAKNFFGAINDGKLRVNIDADNKQGQQYLQ